MADPEARQRRADALVREDRFLSLPAHRRDAILARSPEMADAAKRAGIVEQGPASFPAPIQRTRAQPERRAAVPASRFVPGQEHWRQALITLGETGGGALGAAGGPVGFALGSGFGAAQASLFADFLGLNRSPTVGAGVRRAAEEGLFGATFGAVAGGYNPLKQSIKRRLLGITEDAIEMFRSGQAVGIDVPVEPLIDPKQGIVPATARWFRNVLGRFPVVAGPLQEGQRRLGGQAGEVLADGLDSLAPRVELAELGSNLHAAAKANVGRLRGIINENYTNFRRLAKEHNARIELDTSLTVADDVLERARKGGMSSKVASLAERVRGMGLREVEPSPIIGPGGKPIKRERVFERDPVDWLDFDGTKSEIDRWIDIFSRQGDRKSAGELWQLSKALGDDMRGMRAPPEVLEAFQLANETFVNYAMLYRNRPVSGILEQADPRMFGDFVPTERPTRNIDELAYAAFNRNSPEAVRDLARIVNDPVVMKQAASATVNRVAPRALSVNPETGETFVNLNTLRNELGLFDRANPKRQALVEALGSEAPIKQLEEIVRVMRTIAGVDVVDVSTFAARRAMLGGLGSAARTMVPGSSRLGRPEGINELVGAVVKRAVGIALFAVGTRRFGRMITNPEFMKDLATTVAPNVSDQARIAAAIRVSRLAPQVFGEEEDIMGAAGIGTRERGVGQRLLETVPNVALPTMLGAGTFASRSLPLGRQALRRGAEALTSRLPSMVTSRLPAVPTSQQIGGTIAKVTLGELIMDLEQSALILNDSLVGAARRRFEGRPRERETRRSQQ